MAYGAKIYGTGGDLVVDDTYETYAFLGNYTLTYTGDATNPATTSVMTPVYHNYTVDITSTTRPIIFYKPPWSWVDIGFSYNNAPYFSTHSIPGMAMVALQNIGGNTWRAYFVSSYSGLGGSITVKVFVSTKSLGPSASTGYGMQVKNGSGNLVFDSGWKPLNPKTAIGTLTRMQETISNVLGTQVTFNPTNDINLGSTYLNNSNDVWISAFTREPTITTVVGASPLAYTFVFKVFSMTSSSSSPTGYGFLNAWPAVVNNSTFPAYNAVLGSNQDSQISFLYATDMSTYYP